MLIVAIFYIYTLLFLYILTTVIVIRSIRVTEMRRVSATVVVKPFYPTMIPTMGNMKMESVMGRAYTGIILLEYNFYNTNLYFII